VGLYELRQLIIQTTGKLEDWWDYGGEGIVLPYQQRSLAIYATPEAHMEIQKLLDDLRTDYGRQVAIEARFLTVTENFLEDIGLDLNFTYNFGGKFGIVNFQQGSFENTTPQQTDVPGSLPSPFNAMTITGGYGTVLDDLQVNFLIRATESHRDAKTVTAPKVAVLNGEMANISVYKDRTYVSNWDIESTTTSGNNPVTITYATSEIGLLQDGVFLNVIPAISVDNKYVTLNLMTNLIQLINFKQQVVGIDPTSGEELFGQLPETQTAMIQTHVTVPDGGTLLIGGQKLGAEVQREEGVPVLSKVPVIGRLFDNRSKVKDTSVLLILIKPTILLQSEKEKNAMAALEEEF